MPNWCNNKLTLDDCSPELAAYLEKEGFSFEKMNPVPDDIVESGDWYNWRVNNWGTKWDLEEETQRDIADQLLSEDTDFTANFDTAWAPPIQALQELSKKFPLDSFVLHYVELGCMFAGTAYISEGLADDNMTHNERDTYQFAKEEFDYETPDDFE